MKKIGEAIAQVPAGSYVIGVSGGVDSVVLFDLLTKRTDLELIVAHFDHGIRRDSQQDRKLVQNIAMSHNVPFEYAEGKLKPDASEEKARHARYNFLRHICKKYNAIGIILAHHQDDLLETAIINLLRGTGRYGLSSLQSHKQLVRPLLDIAKSQLLQYAILHQLTWREDVTNADDTYLRNYVRHHIVAKLTPNKREKLYQIIVRQRQLNESIDQEIDAWLKKYTTQSSLAASLPRYHLIMMPWAVSLAILQRAIKHLTGKTMERPLAAKALLFVKTAKPHRYFQLNNTWQLNAKPDMVIVESREHMVS